MRKSVALSAVFLAAIALGLCGRLPLVRGDKPAVHKHGEVGEGQDPFALPPSAKKPPAASSAGKPAEGQDPFAPPTSVDPRAEKPTADAPADGAKSPKSKPKKPAKDVGDPFGGFDSAPEKAVSAPPQCATGKTCATAKKAHPQAIAPSPGPSGQASMKITVGKASSRSTAAELAASEEIIEKALRRPVTWEVVEMPLDRVAEQLARQLDVNVLMDQKALGDVGIDPFTPVTIKVTKLPLRFALDELLRPLQLVWTIRSGALLVTSLEENDRLLTTKVYDVSSLLVSAADYPASRSNDLGDPSPLFDPPPERNGPGGISGMNGFGDGMGAGGTVGGPGGMGGMMNVIGQSASPPILQQRAAGGMGNGLSGPQVPGRYIPRLDFDSLIDSVTATIDPTVWDCQGGQCGIVALQPQQVLVVNATRAIHEKVAAYLDALRHRVETRPQIRIEAHWLWLTEPELASLLAEQDKASPAAGDVVAEAAWKKLRQAKRDEADNAAGDFVEMTAFEAILKGQNGQLISGVSGRQTRVMITLIPVVGFPPATGGGGMGGIGGSMPVVPAPKPAPQQPPAPPPQTPAVPSPVRAYLSQPPSVSYHSGVGYQPVCRTIQEGGALEVRPCVVAGGKEILLDLRSRFVQREDNPDATPQTPAAGVAAGANGAVAAGANGAVAAGANRAAGRSAASVVRAIAAAVDRPQIHHYRLETTLRVPAGRRVLVGGLTYGDPSADETNLYLFVKATVER